MNATAWKDIIGQGKLDEFDWTTDLTSILEMDLFDHSQPNVKLLLKPLKTSDGNQDTAVQNLLRLSFIARSRT